MYKIETFLSLKKGERRYRIVLSETGKTIDDCNGYGFSNYESARNASCLFGVRDSEIELPHGIQPPNALF